MMQQIDNGICPRHIIAKQVVDSLTEDMLTFPDWTSLLVVNKQNLNARIKTKQNMLVCGKEWVEQAFYLCDANIRLKWEVKEGEEVLANTVLCNISGPAKAILSAERTALNFLQTLSATATEVAKYVKVIKHLPVKIMDTRKTLPGLRLAQKYAVTVGGGYNQRAGLYDGVLIKENHISACGGITLALKQAFNLIPPHIPIQIEVETYSQFLEALDNGAKLILLDNMSLDLISKCVNQAAGQAQLEVSGNINLTTVLDYALTGVDRISIGALTKNVQAIDLSMRVLDE